VRQLITSASRRAVDLAVGLGLSLVTLPIVVLAAAVSAAVLRASPFFVHERVGRGGRSFRLVKVRTLPLTTGPYVDKFALDAVEVSPSMARMRLLHIDELPQLWLVVAGKMTLIGPRPEMRVLHDRLDPAFARIRCEMQPGLTGLWQISSHCTGLIGQRPEYDRIYYEYRSWRLDVWIAYRTLLKVLGRGTVALDEVPRWAVRSRVRPQPVVTSEV